MTYNATHKAASVKRRDEVRVRVEELGSYAAVARELGVSLERVRQIVNKGRRVNEPLWQPSNRKQAAPFTPARKAAFLLALAETGTNAKAAARVGVHPATVQAHANSDDEFRRAIDAARGEWGRTHRDAPPGLRRCHHCLLVKPEDEFWAAHGRYDGLSTSCKSCDRARHKAWVQANPQKQDAHNKKWRAANPEAARAIQRRAERKYRRKRRAASWTPWETS